MKLHLHIKIKENILVNPEKFQIKSFYFLEVNKYNNMFQFQFPFQFPCFKYLAGDEECTGDFSLFWHHLLSSDNKKIFFIIGEKADKLRKILCNVPSWLKDPHPLSNVITIGNSSDNKEILDDFIFTRKRLDSINDNDDFQIEPVLVVFDMFDEYYESILDHYNQLLENSSRWNVYVITIIRNERILTNKDIFDSSSLYLYGKKKYFKDSRITNIITRMMKKKEKETEKEEDHFLFEGKFGKNKLVLFQKNENCELNVQFIKFGKNMFNYYSS